MNKIKEKYKHIYRFVDDMLMLSFFVLLLPMIVLSGFGLYALFTLNYFVHFALVTLVVFVLFFVPLWFLKKRKIDTKETMPQQSFVDSSLDWSNEEQKIWQHANSVITTELEQSQDWNALKNQSIRLAEIIAKQFGKKELEFSLLEGMQLLEEISKRYRKVLKDHVPAVEKIKVSQLKSLYEINHKYGEKALAASKISMDLWRIIRLANPVSGIAAEIKRTLIGNLSDQAWFNLQYNIKRAFLQEVAKLCIDLYSGRFQIEQSQISSISEHDQTRIASSLEPIRILIVGQISSGKSSVVNALINSMSAEVSMLPSTDDIHVYPCVMANEEQVRFIDMPGFEATEKSIQNTLKQITHSDFVLWVLKANQSARQLDLTLQDAIDAFYADSKNISRKKPRMIGLLNQVDKLTPVQDWHPPYDLTDLSQAKVKNILGALQYNQSVLNSLDAFYPLALPEDKCHFGLEALQSEIAKHCDNAKNVQRNRQRHDVKSKKNLISQGKRLFKSSKTLIKNSLTRKKQ